MYCFFIYVLHYYTFHHTVIRSIFFPTVFSFEVTVEGKQWKCGKGSFRFSSSHYTDTYEASGCPCEYGKIFSQTTEFFFPFHATTSMLFFLHQ